MATVGFLPSAFPSAHISLNTPGVTGNFGTLCQSFTKELLSDKTDLTQLTRRLAPVVSEMSNPQVADTEKNTFITQLATTVREGIDYYNRTSFDTSQRFTAYVIRLKQTAALLSAPGLQNQLPEGHQKQELTQALTQLDSLIQDHNQAAGEQDALLDSAALSALNITQQPELIQSTIIAKQQRQDSGRDGLSTDVTEVSDFTTTTTPILPTPVITTVEPTTTAKKPTTGISNIGNSCYMNSVLQLLAGGSDRAALTTDRVEDTQLVQDVRRQLNGIFAHMDQAPPEQPVPTAVMQRFFNTLNQAFAEAGIGQFRPGQQSDASEFCLNTKALLCPHDHARLEETITRSYPVLDPNDPVGTLDIVNATAAEFLSDGQAYLASNVSLSDDMRHVSWSMTYDCATPLMNVALQRGLPDVELSPQADIDWVFSVGASPEGVNLLDGGLPGVSLTKQYKFTGPTRDELTVSYNRFDQFRQKISDKRRVLDTIKVPYIDALGRTRTETYEPKAVVLHSGNTIAGGHYREVEILDGRQLALKNDGFTLIVTDDTQPSYDQIVEQMSTRAYLVRYGLAPTTATT